MSDNMTYQKLTLEKLDKFLDDFNKKLKKEPKWTFATGKQGYIEYHKEYWKELKIPESEIDKRVQHLQDTLEDKLYIITA